MLWCIHVKEICSFFVLLSFISCKPNKWLHYRSYSAGDNQVHENPEWEKARQALASINKSQSTAKTTQSNRTTAEVALFIFSLSI